MNLKILIILTVVLVITEKLYSQEIVSEVFVNVEQIAEEKRINVASMKNDVERYINNQKFTDLKWEGPPIAVDITIVLTGGYNNKYSAQLFLASKRNIAGTNGGSSIALKLLEKEWDFEYGAGANLSYNLTRFNEFSSLIDYYMLVVIGFDLDTYTELDGTKAYEAAKQIVQMGTAAGATGYKTFTKAGDFTKYNLVNELSDPRFEPIRKSIYSYYTDGLDIMTENKELGLETIAYILQEMAEFKDKKLTNQSVIFQAFFESKNIELAELFKGYKKYPTVFKNLRYLDPMSSAMYEDAQRGK